MACGRSKTSLMSRMSMSDSWFNPISIDDDKKFIRPHARKPVNMSNKRVVDYIHGVLCGDGYIGEAMMEIALGHDIQYGLILKDIIDKIFGVEAKIVDKKNQRGIYKYFRFYSATLADYYRPRKYPLWDVSSVEYPEEFIAGITDTDGCISIIKTRPEGAIIISQAKLENIRIVKNLLTKIGIDRISCVTSDGSPNSFSENTTIYEIRLYSKESTFKFAELINLRNPTKKEKLIKLVQVRGG